MKILIIDDDASKRALLINALEQFGVTASNIDQATSALSARKIFSAKTFDLVILDLVLPATDRSGNQSAEIGFGLLQAGQPLPRLLQGMLPGVRFAVEVLLGQRLGPGEGGPEKEERQAEGQS